MSCDSLFLNYFKSGALFLATVFFSSSSFAQGAPQVVQAPTASQISAQEQAKSLQNSAQRGQNNANIAVGLGGAAIGNAIGPCWDGSFYHCAVVAAGAATIALSMDAGSKAAIAGFQAGQLQQYTAAAGTTNTSPTSSKFTLPAATISALNNAGIKVDPLTNKVTAPNGMSITPAQAAAGDFSGTGMSKSNQALAKAKLADIMNEAKKQGTADASKSEGSSNGDAGDAGGVGGSAGKIAKFNPNALKFPGFGKGAGSSGKNARKPSSAAGLSKKHGSDSIGVAGDDIFGMMNRRYEAIASSGSFIETIGLIDPPSVGGGGAVQGAAVNSAATISGKPGPGH